MGHRFDVVAGDPHEQEEGGWEADLRPMGGRKGEGRWGMEEQRMVQGAAREPCMHGERR